MAAGTRASDCSAWMIRDGCVDLRPKLAYVGLFEVLRSGLNYCGLPFSGCPLAEASMEIMRHVLLMVRLTETGTKS